MDRRLALTFVAVLAAAGCGGGEAETPTATGETAATGTATGTAPATATGTGTATGAGTATGTGTATSAEATETPPVAIEGEVNVHGVATAEDSLPLELDDFYFEPTFITGPPGASVTLEAFNEGDVQHTFTLDEQGIDEVFEPGAEQTIEVTLPESGHVVFYCRFHRAQGMQGALFIE